MDAGKLKTLEAIYSDLAEVKVELQELLRCVRTMTTKKDHAEEDVNCEGWTVEGCNVGGDNESNQCWIAAPREINHSNYKGKDLLAEFMEAINLLLEDQELTDVEYVSSTKIHIEIPLERAYEYSDGVQEDIEVYFRALFPKIKQLFESVGWEVSLKEKGECGDAALEFHYDVPKSGYWGMVRKLEEADAALVTVE